MYIYAYIYIITYTTCQHIYICTLLMYWLYIYASFSQFIYAHALYFAFKRKPQISDTNNLDGFTLHQPFRPPSQSALVRPCLVRAVKRAVRGMFCFAFTSSFIVIKWKLFDNAFDALFFITFCGFFVSIGVCMCSEQMEVMRNKYKEMSIPFIVSFAICQWWLL